MTIFSRGKVNFCTGPVLPAFVGFTIPVILSSLLHLLFNTADVVVVGKFVSDAAQAAVSSTGSIISTMICLVTGLGAGVSVITAQCVGRGEDDRTERVVHTALAAALVLGLGLAVVCILAAPWVLKLMNFPSDVIAPALTYIRIYFVGLPVQLFYQFGAAVLQAQGDSRRPMYYLTIGGVLNVVTNLLLVLGFGMGVAGVAVATVLSYVVSAILVAHCLMLETGGTHLDVRRLRIHWPTLGRIAAIGVPAGLQSMMFSLSAVLIQSSLNSLGTITVAGSGVAGNLIQYVNMIGNSAHSACVTFAGQNLGAGQQERVKQGYRVMLLMTMGIAAVVSVVVIFLSPWLFKIYTNDPAVVQQGLVHIRTMVPFHFLHAFMQITQGYQRGLGASVFPMIVSMLGTCVLRVCWALLIFPLRPSLGLLVAVYPATWLITGAVQWLHLHYYLPRAFARAQKEQT